MRYPQPWHWMRVIGFLLIGATAFSACRPDTQPLDEGALSGWEAIQRRGQLRAGVKFDSRPFGFLDASGKPAGMDVALLREVSRRLLKRDEPIAFRQVLSSTRVAAIQAGAVDVVAATMTITPERQRLVDFSRPYFTATQAVLVRRSAPIHRLDALRDKTVGYIYGSNSRQTLLPLLPKARYVGFRKTDEAVRALLSGHSGIDAVTTDDTILKPYAEAGCGLKLVPDARLPRQPYGIAMPRQEGENALKERIDRILNDMERDGTLSRLQREWLHARNGLPACPCPVPPVR